MITIIYGDVGSGKTALMTRFAVSHMVHPLAFEDIKACKGVVKRLNKGGHNYTMPKQHLVFADYHINTGLNSLPRRVSNIVDGYYLGLPNERLETLFLPPYSKIFLDEAQRYYNSRMSKKFPNFVSRFYETHRHYNLDIYLACQRSTLIDLNIREIAQRFIEVSELKHKLDRLGRIVKTTWKCVEFYNYFEFEQYLNSGKAGSGTKTEYVFKGDIFTCYSSYGFMPLHLNDRQDCDFEIVPSADVGYDVESIEHYNSLHGFGVPDSFYE